MKKQFFLGQKPEPEKLDPIKNYDYFFVKPLGGLWTSTYNLEKGSAWLEWCITENFGVPNGPNQECWQGWIIVPQLSARIYTIDSFKDLSRLYEKYLRVVDMGLLPCLDYELIALDYDAIHLTEKGQNETKLSMPVNLYGWDCECTLWFRWMFEKVEGPIYIPAREEVDT